jgi:hypothetical protein
MLGKYCGKSTVEQHHNPCFFETGSPYVTLAALNSLAQAGLKLPIFLPQLLSAGITGVPHHATPDL